jgi:hypothetical protein
MPYERAICLLDDGFLADQVLPQGLVNAYGSS